MDLIFDYEKYRQVIREAAGAQKIGIAAFLMDYEVDMRGITPHDRCITITGLYNREPSKDEEVLRHIRTCNFCTRFVKLQLLLYLDKTEMRQVFHDVYANVTDNPDTNSFFRLFSNEELPVNCLGITDIYNFNTLPREKKNHVKTCPQCSAAIDFLRRMPFPKLSESAS